jgi:hypothetical protein
MRITHSSIPIVMLALSFALACDPKPELKSANTNQPAATPTGNTQAEAPKTASETAGATSLASPTAAYEAAFAARARKDPEALKKVLSKEALEFFSEISKIENKTLDDAIKSLVAGPQAATAESRNEKITGDRATLEYLDEKGKWKPMDFVKEGNDWKLTIPKGEKSASPDDENSK